MLALMKDDGAARWQCAKARCLIELGRPDEARELLFAARDPERPDPELEALLAESRRRA